MANEKPKQEIVEEVIEEKKVEEPEKVQNEVKSVFSSKKEGGTRAN